MMTRTASLFFFFVGLLALAGCRAEAVADRGEDGRSLVDRTLKDFSFVQGGSFWMGQYVHEPVRSTGSAGWWGWGRDNRFQHEVELDSFNIQRHEVTYADFDIYTRATGQPLLNEDELELKMAARKPNKPAIPSWQQARAYCQWLGEQTGLPFDLPTEAQWEYAARSRGRWVGFATDTGLADPGRNIADYVEHGYAVGSYPPNPLGLYDMNGNAREWVRDWYDPWYYWYSPRRNPQGPETGKTKVIRGGSSSSSFADQTVYTRGNWKPEKSLVGTGFRCVVNVDHPLPHAFVASEADIERALKGGERPPVREPGARNYEYLPKAPVPEQVKPMIEAWQKAHPKRY